MALGHTIGIVLGALAVGLAAFSSYSIPDDYGKYTAALAAAFAAASLYLLHAYPAEVSPSQPQPPPSP